MPHVKVPFVVYPRNDVQRAIKICYSDLDEPIPNRVTSHTARHVFPVFLPPSETAPSPVIQVSTLQIHTVPLKTIKSQEQGFPASTTIEGTSGYVTVVVAWAHGLFFVTLSTQQRSRTAGPQTSCCRVCYVSPEPLFCYIKQ